MSNNHSSVRNLKAARQTPACNPQPTSPERKLLETATATAFKSFRSSVGRHTTVFNR